MQRGRLPLNTYESEQKAVALSLARAHLFTGSRYLRAETKVITKVATRRPYLYRSSADAHHSASDWP